MCLPLAVLGPIIGGAVAAGGSALATGVSSANAANAQKDAAGQAMDLQRDVLAQQNRMYEQGRADMSPWLDSGRSSLGELLRQMQGGQFDQRFDASQLANDPGYQFRMAEGQKALERSASARGFLDSGKALKSLSRYSQGVASDEFGNAWNRNQAENTGRFNRLASMAGVGQTAAQNLGSLGAQQAGQVGQYGDRMGGLYGAVGNANAAQGMATGNAVSNGFNTFGGLLGYGLSQGGQSIPTQTPSYGTSTMGYPTQGYGPWR